jgi:CDP-diacylglycerol---glycerol-3-phosphate 3-phosphatidyltransferase
MIAHAVTLSRLGIAAGFIVCLVRAMETGGLTTGWTILLVAIAVAEEATDIVDGVIARRLGTAGPIGGILDPLCDSLSRLAMYFALALCGLVTIAVPLVMTGRDIVVSYVRIFSALTGGRTSARVSGKLKTIVQGSGAPLLVLVAWQRPHLSPEATDRWTTWIAVAVIAVTVWSLVDYLTAAASAYRTRTR